MLISFIDYYLFYMIFFILLFLLLPTFKYFNYQTIHILIYFKTNFTSFLLIVFKIIIFFTFLFYILGFIYFSSAYYPVIIFKNILLLSKIFLLIFLFLFLFMLEYYIKLVYWYSTELLVLFYFSIIALFIILYSENFLNFYLLLELYTLSIIAAIGLRRVKNKMFIESVFKYFVINTVSSCFMLFGISTIYAYSGIIDFLDLRFFFVKYFLSY